MTSGQSVTQLIDQHEHVLSVEFFPPKTEEDGVRMLQTAQTIREQLNPHFVSITYGAGGTTRERTMRYAVKLKEDCGFEVMPHLTCVGSSRAELKEIITGFHQTGFRNIMALRGDPPKGQESFEPAPDGLRYGSDMVAFIKEHFADFCLGGGGYPEKHPEAASAADDLQALKIKVDAGADFLTTQLFFDNVLYFQFVEACRSVRITVPIIPGIMPVFSLGKIRRFCNFCGASIPEGLITRLEAAEGDAAAESEVGTQWAFEQIKELLEKGAPGVHLYAMNRSEQVTALVARLREAGIVFRTG